MNTTSALMLTFVVISAWGCARIRVEAPKEPIKVDVSMRLDIYQHIEKDIDKIESMVTGGEEKPQARDNQSLFRLLINEAYAEEGLGVEVEEAALRRKERRPQLVSLEENGVIGENKSGLVEIRISGQSDSAAALVQEENNDRMTIYRQVAEKNGSSVEDVQKLYAKRLQSDAPKGTPIEVIDDSGAYEWKLK